MKNPTLLMALMVAFLYPCSKTLAQSAPGVVPNDIGLFDIVLDSGKYTWIDLDTFYQNTVLKKSSEIYFSNLKKMTIGFLVRKFDLTGKANVEKVAYYINEQLQLNLVEADVFIKCLEKMKGYWTNELIRNAALQKYNDGKEFMIHSLGEAFWQESAAKFEAIRTFADSLPNR